MQNMLYAHLNDTFLKVSFRNGQAGKRASLKAVTPTKITSIKVVVNSGTAKGNEYNLTKEEKTDIYNNIVKTFLEKT